MPVANSKIQYKKTLGNGTTSCSVTVTSTNIHGSLLVFTVQSTSTVATSPTITLTGGGTVYQSTLLNSTLLGTQQLDAFLVNQYSSGVTKVSASASNVIVDMHVFEYYAEYSRTASDGQSAFLQSSSVATNPSLTFSQGGNLGPAGNGAEYTLVFSFSTDAGVTPSAPTAISDTAGALTIDVNTAGTGNNFSTAWVDTTQLHTLTGRYNFLSDTVTVTQSGNKSYVLGALSILSDDYGLVQGNTTGTLVGGLGGHDLTLPLTPTNGNMILAFYVQNGAAANNEFPTTVTDSNGALFTLAVSVNGFTTAGTFAGMMAAYYKIVAGSPTGKVTFNGTYSALPHVELAEYAGLQLENVSTDFFASQRSDSVVPSTFGQSGVANVSRNVMAFIAASAQANNVNTTMDWDEIYGPLATVGPPLMANKRLLDLTTIPSPQITCSPTGATGFSLIMFGLPTKCSFALSETDIYNPALPGQTAVFKLTSGPDGSTQQDYNDVTWSVTGIPAGWSYWFDPAITPWGVGSTYLYVSVPSSATTNVYPLTITGTTTLGAHTVAARLNVTTVKLDVTGQGI